MLRGIVSLANASARDVEGFDRLERSTAPADLVVRGALAIAPSGPLVTTAEHGTTLCVFDGRLYNASALARELGIEGSAPAEVVLELHRRAGAAALGQLRGTFSMVLWDAAGNAGLLSCDLLATRPLFLRRGSGRLAFSGELAELLDLLPSRPAPDPTGFVMWLAGGLCPSGGTLYENVERLDPGELIELTRGVARRRAYWRPAYSGTMSGSRPELAAGLRDELERSTARRLSDRRTGVVLSGGLDSSIVTTFASRTRGPGAEVQTYSAVFPGDEFDESDKILELTRALGIDAATFTLEPRGTLRLALGYTRRSGLPLGGAGALIDIAIAGEAAADGAEVLLDGQTGDEVLGFAPYLVADRLARGRLLGALELTTRWPLGRPTTRRDRKWILRELGLKGLAPHWLGRYVTSRRTELRGPVWLRPELRRRFTELDDRWRWKLGPSGPRWWRHLADSLISAPHRELRIDYLRHRAAAVGVINESPLYDFDLIDYCLRLPPELAFDSYLNRPLAREAMRDLMPEAIRLQAQKAVFSSFVVDAIKGPDATGIESLLTDADAELGAYLDTDYVRTLWHRGQPGATLGSISWGTTVWRMVAAECWLRFQTGSRLIDEMLARDDIPSPGVSRVALTDGARGPVANSPEIG